MQTNKISEHEKKLAELNKDYTLDDAAVLWCGEFVYLHKGSVSGPLLASFRSSNPRIRELIAVWCVKNSYRCTALHDGRIWL